MKPSSQKNEVSGCTSSPIPGLFLLVVAAAFPPNDKPQRGSLFYQGHAIEISKKAGRDNGCACFKLATLGALDLKRARVNVLSPAWRVRS